MNEVATTNTELTTAPVGLDAFGTGDLTSQDIVIPKIWIMQGLSQLVADGDARMGDIVDSVSKEVLGNIKDKWVDFIPFHLDKNWCVMKKIGGQFKFDRYEKVTPLNESRSWEEVVDGVEYKWEKHYQFYVLRPEDVSLPYVLTFKSTSLKTGKELATQMFVKNRTMGKVPPAYVMTLYGEQTKNDKGTYVVPHTRIRQEATPEQIQECLTWYKTITSGDASMHNDNEPTTDYAQETQF